MSSWQAEQQSEGHTVVMVAQAVQPVCELTRGELDGYLRESRYGKDEAAFACYFTREHPSVPPLCIACGHRLADHRNAPGRQQQIQQSQLPARTSISTMGRASVTFANVKVDPPSTLTVGGEYDTAELWTNTAFFIAAGIVLLVCLIQFIVFSAVDIPVYAMAAPVVLLILGVVFIALGKKTTVVFHTKGSRRGFVDITTKRLATWCCPTERTVRIDEVSNVRPVQTNLRVNKSYIYEVTCDIGSTEGDTLVLYSDHYGEAVTQSRLWAAYLNKVRQQN